MKHLSETDFMNLIRINRSKSNENELLWRNNVGAVITPNGRTVRYGLANDSKNINQRIKSADLIGIRRIKITERDVGREIGQFVSLEIKKPGAKMTKKTLAAQVAWQNLILAYGGHAKIINSIEENVDEI